MTGPQFNALHGMFETQCTELATAVDLVAERTRALGNPAPGSYEQYAMRTSIPQADGVPAATDLIKQLVEGHDAVAKTARQILSAWMLRSMLE